VENIFHVDVVSRKKGFGEIKAGSGPPRVDEDILKTVLEQKVIAVTERKKACH